MLKQVVCELAKDRAALQRIVLEHALVIGQAPTPFDHVDTKVFNVEREELRFIGEMLVERRTANQRLVAQHRHRHIFESVFAQQFGARSDQRAIRLLHAKIHSSSPDVRFHISLILVSA